MMPEAYAKVHRQFIDNFFLRGDTVTELKSRLLFMVMQSSHILPVSVDVKIN